MRFWKLFIFGSEIQNIGAKAVLRIYDILLLIRIRGSMPMNNGSGSGFGSGFGSFYSIIIEFQDANKKLIFYKSFLHITFLRLCREGFL
jgi:hypothetical protein